MKPLSPPGKGQRQKCPRAAPVPCAAALRRPGGRSMLHIIQASLHGDQNMSISIGSLRLRNRVLLAPMAGVSDAPFRACAWRCGAGLTFSEMVAGAELLRRRGKTLRRMAPSADSGPFAVQLVGHDPQAMEKGARLAAEAGARLIDINMGCPARLVAARASGAALMRHPALALRIVEAVVRGAGGVPVSVKMRLGWDEGEITAPRIARMAAEAGARMITVHARTRSQFYSGRADWAAVAAVVDAVSVPVIVNGDITDAASARRALALSGAAGVMVGRACQGRPWLAGELAEELDPGSGIAPLPLPRQMTETMRMHEEMLAFHGPARGLRMARKHLGWALARWRAAGLLDTAAEARWRARLLRAEAAADVHRGLEELSTRLLKREAA